MTNDNREYAIDMHLKTKKQYGPDPFFPMMKELDVKDKT